MSFCRKLFHTSASLNKRYSTVEPVHHLIKINKAALKPKYKYFTYADDDIRKHNYIPKEYGVDRVSDHYHNTLESDLLLKCYVHDKEDTKTNNTEINKIKSRHIPYNSVRKTKTQLKLNSESKEVRSLIPKLESIFLSIYSKDVLKQAWMGVSAKLQLSILTNVKAKATYCRKNDVEWGIRIGRLCGAKVELKGMEMTRFVTTLTELVLPRIKSFKGISKTSGDKNGNISFCLRPEDVRFFPEIEYFNELYPILFGMYITFITTSKTDQDARYLLSSLGFPFMDS